MSAAIGSSSPPRLWQPRRLPRRQDHQRRMAEPAGRGRYHGQRIVRPGARTFGRGQEALKFDLRNYAYNGQVQWVAARLYQGQTTNFRTPGGGFAPVVAYCGQVMGSPANEICNWYAMKNNS